MNRIRIAVVDDDSLIRLGICSSVDWGQHGYEVVGEAENGQTGWEMIQRTQPDIVFLDISMPVMDGIEVLKLMQQAGVRTRAVILSCHDDFHLVKEAMKNGAYDYLRKSEINSDNLLCVVDEICQSLLERDLAGEQAAESGSWENYSNRYASLKRLVTGRGGDGPADQARWLSIRERELYCAAFAVAGYQQVIQRYDEGYPFTLEHGVVNLAKEVLRQRTAEVELFVLKENLYVLLLSGADRREELFSLLEQMASVLKNYLNVEVLFGVGGVVQSFSALPGAFRQAVYSQKLHYLRPGERIIQETRPPEDTMGGPVFHRLAQGVADMAAQKSYPQLFAGLGEAIGWLRRHSDRNLDVDGVREFLKETVRSVLVQEGKTPEQALIRLQNCGSLDETEEFFTELQKEVQSEGAGQNHYLIRAATEYIQQNLSRGDISLGEIADYLMISKSYLCRLFQKKLGVSVQHYIHNIRIEKAKEYLNDFHLKIYEIAELTGFNSSTHFNIVFKKIMNCTPVEYRNGLKH